MKILTLVFSTYSFRPFARNGSQSYFRQTAFQSIKSVVFFSFSFCLVGKVWKKVCKEKTHIINNHIRVVLCKKKWLKKTPNRQQLTRIWKVAKVAILQRLWYRKMVKNGGTGNFLFFSLLISFAGGNSKETIWQFAARAVFDARAIHGTRVECADVFAH